ncbi:uncharacterized protein LOC126776363 [Nymphalis io]|uniref:uncharacterized protein LOC126776363 n=1 Tax=Inachis io TaxID=171585 RepID=UPI0021681DD9|nr:uncharacterized protein LOC126776363 [Nymphalis io]
MKTINAMLLWCIYFVIFIFCDAKKYDISLKEKHSLNKDSLKHYHKNTFTTKNTIKSSEQLNIYNTNNSAEDKRTVKNKNEIDNTVKHLLTFGSFKILATIKFIKRNLKSTQNITNLADASIQNYSSLLIRMYENIPNDTYKSNIDKEFVILNLVVTANEVVYDINKEILRKIINRTKIGLVDIYNKNIIKLNLKKELYNNYMDDKKEYMEYVCENYNICRMYPAYSDYIADILNEILKLSNARFHYFVTNSIILFREQASFFETLLGEKLLVTKIKVRLEVMFYGDISDTRKIFLMIKRILIEKYKLLSPNKKNNKNILKAVVILIDIINEAFDNDEDEILKIFFDNTINSLRHWSNIEEDDISRLLGNIVRHFVNTLKYNWKPFVRNEVKTLVDIIIKGRTTNKDVYKYLFSEGSKYIKTKREDKTDL